VSTPFLKGSTEQFQREIRCEPGYDFREEDAHKPSHQRRGCHGMNMRWLLHGQYGTIQFLIYTSWLPSWVKEGQWGPRVDDHGPAQFRPMAADLGHHWDRPTYDGEDSMTCDIRSGGTCFYDGSGLNAEPLFAKLLTNGSEAVWAEMEAYYWRLVPKQLEPGPQLLEADQ
jgi:hypothetical protein